MTPTEMQFADEHEAFAAAMAGEGAAPAAGQPEQDQTVQPEGAPAGVEQPQQDAGDQAVDNAGEPTQPAVEDEVLSSLPDEVRQYVEQVRNREQEALSKLQLADKELARARNDHASMAGKLRPLQQKLAEYERQQQQPAPNAPSTPAPPAGQSGEAVQDLDAYLQTPEWKEYAELFPKEAAVWERGQRVAVAAAERIAKREAERVAREIDGRYSPVLTEITNERATKAHQSAIDQLASEHPDWQKIDSDEGFWAWFDNTYMPDQLDVVQQAFSNPQYQKKQLSNPAFVSKLLTQYKQHAGMQTSTQASKPQSAPAQSAPNARLQMAAAPNIRPTPASNRIPIERMTPDQAFQAALNSPDA